MRPIELFFDLVFVYAISQVTGLVAHPHGPLDYLQAVLAFISMVWMYGGYVWLTSNLALDNDRDIWLLFVALGGFFFMAFSMPTIMGVGGPIFALALLVNAAIHLYLFSRVPNSSARAIWQIAPVNLLAALIVLAATFTPSPWRWLLWTGTILLHLAVQTRQRRRSRLLFSLSPRHFVERSGLLIIIAVGESIMALGHGIEEVKFSASVFWYVMLGLLLAGSLWWSYFGPDNERAEHHMVQATPQQRVAYAAHGYGSAHFIMLFGIILSAASLKVASHDPLHHTDLPTALNLSVGLALYYLGDVLFRRNLHLGPSRLRSVLALGLLCTLPLGLYVNGFVQLLVCTLLIMAVTFYEDYVLEPLRVALVVPSAPAHS